MNLKTIAILATISSSSIAQASYNNIIYIPTSVKYDVERSLDNNLDFIQSRGRFVSYWNKSAFKDFCKTTESTLSELKSEISEISEKFLESSESFRHRGKAEINKAILNLDEVVREGLSPITVACKTNKRMKEAEARSLVSNIGQVESKFYQARNKLSVLVKNYGKVIRVYEQANTSKFNGKYVGHQGVMSGFKKCHVNIKVEGDKARLKFKDQDSKFEMTRDLVDMSLDKKELKNFSFDREIKTNTICSAKGTTFAKLDFENGSLVNFKATHRGMKKAHSGLDVLIKCFDQNDEILKNVFADKYKCYDLKKKH